MKTTIKRIRFYKKQYTLKALLLFLLFLSLNIIFCFASLFADQIYGYSNSYAKDSYYSTQFTNPRDSLVNRIEKELPSSDYSVVFGMDSITDKKTISFIGYYTGDLIQNGYTQANRVFISVNPGSVTSLSPDSEATCLASKNIPGESIDYKNQNYAISTKADFSFPGFFTTQIKNLGYDQPRLVLIRKDNPTIDDLTLIDSIVIRNAAFVKAVSKDYPFSKGETMNQERNSTFTNISMLFFGAFLIPYSLVLIFWSQLIAATDLETKKELNLLRIVGYSKGALFRIFFGENTLLSIPGILLSLGITLPTLFVLFPSVSLYYLYFLIATLIYFLLFNVVYSKRNAAKIFRNTIF
jgi:ABC-type antimicrobial peptide transport system permease subunit